MSAKEPSIEEFRVPQFGSGKTDQYQELDLHEEVELKPLEKVPKAIKLYRIHDKKNHTYKPGVILTLGSAGEQAAVDVQNLMQMTDPYSSTTRKWLSDAAYTDPTLSIAIPRRLNSFFSEGYSLELELKSMRNPITGEQMIPEEAKTNLAALKSQYVKFLMQLEEWDKEPDIQTPEKMRTCLASKIVQGRFVCLMTPKRTELLPGKLPVSLKIITWEDTSQPIIDIVFWKMLGVRLNFIKKDFASPEEMIYQAGKELGLRKDSAFYGASEFEPIIQLSRINRKLLNYNFSKAAEAAYITKLLVEVPTMGAPTDKENVVQSVINDILKQGTDIIGVEFGSKVTPVPVSVDTPMLEMLATTIDDRLISAAGSTKAQMGRTANLNRDTATIMEVEFIKNVRTPDENQMKTAFEDQLYNPLFAHLVGRSPKEIPVRVVIKRKETQAPIQDKRLEQKTESIDKQELIQPDAQNKTLGSSGFWNTPQKGWKQTPLEIWSLLMQMPEEAFTILANKIIKNRSENQSFVKQPVQQKPKSYKVKVGSREINVSEQ